MRVAVIVVIGVALLIWWFLANRAHIARREYRAADWQGEERRPDLWTSSAACVHCGEHGGLLEVSGDRLQFECLSCGRRHHRETRG